VPFPLYPTHRRRRLRGAPYEEGRYLLPKSPPPTFVGGEVRGGRA